MFGQLQNNFRKFVTGIAFSSLLLSSSALAETVSGRLIYADWFVLVKDEAGKQTVMARGEPWPGGPRPVMVQFSIDETAAGNNNLYIIAGSRANDSLEPFLAFSLNSEKTLQSGDSTIEVFQSDYADISAPTNPVMIKEIIEGDMGGGAFQATAPLIYGSAEKSLGTSTVPGMWFEGQQDNGRAVVFRLPYSALLNAAPSPTPDTPEQREAMLNHINLLEGNLILANDDIKDLTEELAKKTKAAETTFELLKKRDAEIVTLNAEITKLKNTQGGIFGLKNLWLWLAMGLGLSGFVGFLFGRRGGQNSMSSKEYGEKVSFPVHILKPEGDSFVPVCKQYPEDMINYDADKGELTFDLATSAVISGSSKLIPAKGNIPSTVPAVQTAYHAVGRVGLAQKRRAVGRDKSLGTAILIDKDRVMTNRHVFDKIYKLIGNPRKPIGVEFFGERNSDASEFYELTAKDAIIIEEYDAIILKLAKPVTKEREPIKFSTLAPETYDETKVFVIGYPARPARYTDEIRQAMNGDRIFSVKRYSEGKIFRHIEDTDNEYGVETIISGRYSVKNQLLAICHQASTLPGNSGSAIISQETGDLIGLHFGTDKFDRRDPPNAYPANVAHSGVFLSKSVTFITSGAFRNYLKRDTQVNRQKQ